MQRGAPPVTAQLDAGAGVPHLRNDRPLVLLLAAGLALALWLGTQVAAWHLPSHWLGTSVWRLPLAVSRGCRVGGVVGASASLAAFADRRWRSVAPLLLVLAATTLVASLGPVYTPWAIVRWQLHFGQSAVATESLRQGWCVVAVATIVIDASVLRVWRLAVELPEPTSHGSARWGDGARLRGPTGLIVGRQGSRLLRLGGEGHILTVAPTRSGKGVSAVIPNLLAYPGSILVTDPKGENHAVTARRRREMGQTVHALDPFDVVGGVATANPLDLIDAASPDAIDDARLLAEMLVLSEGRERDDAFWNEEARGLITGLVLHVAANPQHEGRTLGHVRTLLTLSPDTFDALLAEMEESTAVDGLVARAAARLLQKADRERSGVISTAQSHTHFLDSPRMTTVLARSSVDFAALKREPMTVYLVLPPDRLDSYARWLRLMIACALRAQTRATGRVGERVVFLLDEFAHLGRMTPIQRDIGLVGGYGARFWLIVQDFSQLRTAYGEAWQTFLANADALQAFGANDWDTAEYLSKMTGDATVRVTSDNRSTGVSRGRTSQRQLGAARTTTEHARRLLTPDEVRRLAPDEQLLFLRGDAPLRSDRVNYLDDPTFRDHADPNPLYGDFA